MLILTSIGWKILWIGIFLDNCGGSQRIPVYYINGNKDNFVVAKNIDDALKSASKKVGKELKKTDIVQESDVLDMVFILALAYFSF